MQRPFHKQLLFSPHAAVDHPHSFSCKLELGSDQEIPSDWYPFVTMECEIMGAVVSQTRVMTLGTANDIQPQKHVTSWTRYHCQVRHIGFATQNLINQNYKVMRSVQYLLFSLGGG